MATKPPMTWEFMAVAAHAPLRGPLNPARCCFPHRHPHSGISGDVPAPLFQAFRRTSILGLQGHNERPTPFPYRPRSRGQYRAWIILEGGEICKTRICSDKNSPIRRNGNRMNPRVFELASPLPGFHVPKIDCLGCGRVEYVHQSTATGPPFPTRGRVRCTGNQSQPIPGKENFLRETIVSLPQFPAAFAVPKSDKTLEDIPIRCPPQRGAARHRPPSVR